MHLEIHHPRRKLIGLTPLIDVVFILLVFFMLASSFLDWRAIALDTPVKGGAGEGAGQAVLIRLAPDGGLDLNGEALTLETLTARVRGMVEQRPELSLRVQPAQGVALQRLVTVLDALEGVGAKGIALVGGPGTAS